MRTKLAGVLFLNVAILAGCESSKEEEVDFVSMPKDMAVDIWQSKEAAKPASTTPATTAAPEKQ
jgi:hypothetical protein